MSNTSDRDGGLKNVILEFGASMAWGDNFVGELKSTGGAYDGASGVGGAGEEGWKGEGRVAPTRVPRAI